MPKRSPRKQLFDASVAYIRENEPTNLTSTRIWEVIEAQAKELPEPVQEYFFNLNQAVDYGVSGRAVKLVEEIRDYCLLEELRLFMTNTGACEKRKRLFQSVKQIEEVYQQATVYDFMWAVRKLVSYEEYWEIRGPYLTEMRDLCNSTHWPVNVIEMDTRYLQIYRDAFPLERLIKLIRQYNAKKEGKP